MVEHDLKTKRLEGVALEPKKEEKNRVYTEQSAEVCNSPLADSPYHGVGVLVSKLVSLRFFYRIG